jgi:putative peptidoglycan lipid II flippase
MGLIVQMFALGLVPFTIFYMALRGYYAFEDTRTPFWLNVVLNALNGAFALTLWALAPTDLKVAALALGYSLAYWVTALLTWRRLGRRLGSLQTSLTVRTLVRLVLAATVATAPAFLAAVALTRLLGHGNLAALVQVLGALAAGGAVFVWLAVRLRVTEVHDLVSLVGGRLRRAAG